MKAVASLSDTALSGEKKLAPDIAQEILRAVAGIEYGSVEIIIHDSRVMQIERKEKVRLIRC